MIDYTLAKELKDARFPQLYENGEVLIGEECELCGNHTAYAPTLEELIEACGEEFGRLIRVKDYPSWYCERYGRWSKEDGEFEGKTPEESVARLWLALNKK